MALPRDNDDAPPWRRGLLDIGVHAEVAMPPAGGRIGTGEAIARADRIGEQIQALVLSIARGIAGPFQQLVQGERRLLAPLLGRQRLKT